MNGVTAIRADQYIHLSADFGSCGLSHVPYLPSGLVVIRSSAQTTFNASDTRRYPHR